MEEEVDEGQRMDQIDESYQIEEAEGQQQPMQMESIDEEQSEEEAPPPKNRKLRKEKPKQKRKKKQNPQASSSASESENDEENLPSFKLPKDRKALQQLLREVKTKIKGYKLQFLHEIQSNEGKKSFVGQNSVPICADIREFDFAKLAQKQKQLTGRQFDVIMMDPPWKLSSSQPSRGVAIQYNSLSDEVISHIPVPGLQESGFLFVWVINNKFAFTVDLMESKWGYRVIDQIPWVKATVNGKIAKGHGFYLQHAKQMCIVGVKGDPPYNKNQAHNVIFAERRGQSQKPTQIYEYIQAMVPNGYYLEIFGRRNNLRDRWVTIGNQL